MAKIILLRHAKVDINNSKIYAKDLNIYIKKYNHLPIIKTKLDSKLKELIEDSNFFITSELTRAKDTLKLFNKEPNLITYLFNEADLPYANFKTIKLPAKVWIVIFRVLWLLGYSKNATSYKDTKLRAKEASNKLIELTNSNKTIVLVGHGVINKIIIKELKKKGLTVAKYTGYGNLNYTILN